MTSSSKYLQPGQPKWNPSKFEFKSYDTHCEPGLVSLLFLACGKPEITKKCLESTQKALKHYSGEVEFCFMENGSNNKNRILFEELNIERKKIIHSDNWGIMSAWNDLYSISRGEYCLVLENDFWNKRPDFNFLQHAKDILDEDKNVGCVYLRDCWDLHENWGLGKNLYLPYTCSYEDNQKDNIYVKERFTKSGHKYLIANHPNFWNNNPQLVRKELWRKCGLFNEPILGSCPKHDETHWQIRAAKTGYLGSYINESIYIHVGGALADEFSKE